MAIAATSLNIIGKGAFGTALARLYSNAGFQLCLHGRDFPVHPSGRLIVLAVPTKSLSGVLERLKPDPAQVLVLCCKGLLPSGAVPSSLVLPSQRFAILSGPGFADELGALLPTAHSIAAQASLGKVLGQTLSTPSFRLYWSDDPIGTQVCGAFKNVLAIAAGVARGLVLGENARAALITRGAAEMRRLVVASGGREQTLWSPAGIGDLVLTCSSPTSRNFRFGELLASGMPADEAAGAIGTVEGLFALSGVLAMVPDEQAPIAAMLRDIVEARTKASDAVALLMDRPVRPA